MLKKVCDICGKEANKAHSVTFLNWGFTIKVSIDSITKTEKKFPTYWTSHPQYETEYRDFCVEHQKEILLLALEKLDEVGESIL